MRSVRALALSLFLSLAFVGSSVGLARAAEVETSITTDTVGVGETFRVQLSLPVSDGDAEPSAPTLPVRGPAELRGPSIGTSRSITMHNFSFSSQTQVTATFSITATGPGKIVIGPGSFQLGSKRVSGEVFEVRVHDGPPRRGRSTTRDPFDDFFRGSPFDLLRDRGGRFELPLAPEGLQLEHAPDAVGFLVARVSKTNLVVGETVNLTVYAYGSRGVFQEANPVEPSLGDFLSFREVQSSFEEQRYQTTIDGRTYQVAKLRQIVLVPLRSGALEIGPMRAILAGRGYPAQSPLGYPVQSQPLKLEVRDAPLEGQPHGFFAGDVGKFQMDLELTPKKLTEGEYALLSVHLKGTGNLPTRVQLPEGTGWEWQKPTTRGDPEVRNGELTGTRTIEVGLRATQPGDLDLGEVTLPYYDPALGAYRVLRKRLPTLEVLAKPPETPAPGRPEPSHSPKTASKSGQSLDELTLTPRTKPASALDPLSIPPLIWALIFGAPPSLLFTSALLFALKRTLRRVRASRSQGPTPHKRAEQAIQQLKKLKSDAPARELSAALRRAIEAVLSARFATSGRGLTQTELFKELIERGASDSDATWLQALLSRVEEGSFGGTPLTSSEVQEAARHLAALLANGKGKTR